MRILLVLCLALLTSGCIEDKKSNSSNSAAQNLANGLNFNNGEFAAPTPTPTPTPTPDTQAPTITLIGNNPLIHTQGTPFADPGALVSDNKDNDRNIAGLGTVDNNTLGTYTITYNASDEAGNNATEVTRIVIVQAAPTPTPTPTPTPAPDTVPPVITLLGANPLVIPQGDTYTDPEATVTDNKDTTRTITGAGTVDVNTVGTYTITYNASDEAGNNATEVTRTVEVQTPPDTEPPVISLIGASTINLDQGDTFEDPGATVTDNVDSTQTITGTGSVATNTVGSYTLTYNATDVAGNIAIPVTRTVIVNLVDTEAPVISLIGSSTITLTIGGTFTDPGAVVTDNVDAVRTITGTGTVDTNATGSYTLTYNATDVAGNNAVEVTRPVVVEAAPTPTPTPTPPPILTNESLVSTASTPTATLAAGSNNLPGWNILSPVIGYAGGGIGVNNTMKGSIEQNIATTPGRQYTVTTRIGRVGGGLANIVSYWASARGVQNGVLFGEAHLVPTGRDNYTDIVMTFTSSVPTTAIRIGVKDANIFFDGTLVIANVRIE